jgi:hypothetical protein
MNTDKIIAIIRRIKAGKTAAHAVPSHALFREVANAYGNAREAREILEELLSGGVIEAGPTINDRYIRVVEYYQ